jgi:hypothetical protein
MPHQPGLFIDQMYGKQTYDMTKVSWLGMILHDTRLFVVRLSKRPYKTFEELRRKGKNVRIAITASRASTDVIVANNRLGFMESISPATRAATCRLAVMRGDADALAFARPRCGTWSATCTIPFAVFGAESGSPNTRTGRPGRDGQPELNSMVLHLPQHAAPPNMPPILPRPLRVLIGKS